MWAVIGGSGFEKFEGFKIIDKKKVSTPFGEVSSGLSLVQAFGKEFLFLSRHGRNHELLPSEINHKANIFALKKLGTKGLLSISAVGSLREELVPGDVVIPDQYIDRTRKIWEQTSFLGRGLVGHLSMADPIDLEIFEPLKCLSSQVDFKVHFKKTYICIEGPHFSTRAESLMYRGWGADIIGMTNFPEYSLAKEANILYIPLSFVTDYDCWKEEESPVTLEQVLKIMSENNKKAFKILELILNEDSLQKIMKNYNKGLPQGLMTLPHNIPYPQKIYFEVLSSHLKED